MSDTIELDWGRVEALVLAIEPTWPDEGALRAALDQCLEALDGWTKEEMRMACEIVKHNRAHRQAND